MANFGIGFGAAMKGFETGLNIGGKLKTISQDNDIGALRKQGLEEARQARGAAIDGMITDNGVAPTPEANQAAAASPTTAPGVNDTSEVVGTYRRDGSQVTEPSAPSATPIAVADPTGQVVTGSIDAPAPAPSAQQQQTMAAEKGIGTYSVDGQTFTDQKKAYAEASKKAPSTLDMFAKNGMVDKIQEKYVEQGRMDLADGWKKWATNKDGEQAIKQWAGAWSSAQAGDYDAAATQFGKYYTEHVNDDVDYLGHKTITDDKGNVSGFAIQLKNTKTGKETEMQMTPESMLTMGAANNPQTLYANAVARKATADAAKIKLAELSLKGAAASGLQTQRDEAAMNREVVKGEAAISREGAKLEAQINTKIEMLKKAGMSQEDINTKIPTMILGEAYSKGASPEEMSRLAFKTRQETDRKFSTKTREEQQAVVSGDIQVIMNAALVKANPKAGAAALGVPSTKPASKEYVPATGKRPFYDPKTGVTSYH